MIPVVPLIPIDGGPIYTETDLSRFPVEPLNAVTIFAFLWVIYFWVKKTKLNFKNYPVIVSGMPILALGFVGGLLYHSFRSNNLWLKLDYMPIAILAFIGAGYFWVNLFKLARKWFILSCSFVIFLFCLERVALTFQNRQLFISLGYINFSILILLPGYLVAWVNSGRGMRQLFLATTMFAIAITFRILDFTSLIRENFPYGTHFLWHLFGAAAAFYILEFIFNENSAQIKRTKPMKESAKNMEEI